MASNAACPFEKKEVYVRQWGERRVSDTRQKEKKDPVS